MFAWQFLFGSLLWALPVAALPVLLHLLFRRRSPVVEFPTLRFIRSSLQHTAARRRLQRWLLLACRVILLGLLILAVAQPVRQHLAGAASSGSVDATVVVDTSYSMLFTQGQTSLLQQADSALRELLGDPALPLKNAQVALFTSGAGDPNRAVVFRDASQILSDLPPLSPQPNPQPLQQRIDQAVELLGAQQATQKWLVVLSDLQRHELVRPIAEIPDARMIVIDLHPAHPDGAAITRVAIAEAQPQPGILSDAVVDVAAHNSDAPRSVTLSLTQIGSPAQTLTPRMASFDAAGLAEVHFPIKLPPGGYLLLTASLQTQETLSWAAQRSELIQMPPPQKVTFIDAPGQAAAQRFMRLALQSYQNQGDTKPLDLQRAANLTGRENVAIVPLTQWPTRAAAVSFDQFVRHGGTLVLALEPGLENLWPSLAADQRAALVQLLPAEPIPLPIPAGTYNPSLIAAEDWLLAGITDDAFQLRKIAVRRFVPFLPVTQSSVTTLLSLSPAEPGAGVHRPMGLLFRKTIGSGMVYTLATLPDPAYTDLATRYPFLPLMVRMALRPPQQNQAANIELGQPMILGGPEVAGVSQLYVQSPSGQQTLVPASKSNPGHFEFPPPASAPLSETGLYQWRLTPAGPPIAMTNVQYPAAETETLYHDAGQIFPPGPSTLIARSAADISTHFQQLNRPQPQWTLPIALVLFLLCFEALLGNLTKKG